MTYTPPPQVLALAEQAHGTPIAHAIKPNGDVVIVFEDGRKLTFAQVIASEAKQSPQLRELLGEIPPPNVIASRSPDPERSEGEGAAKKQSPRKKG